MCDHGPEVEEVRVLTKQFHVTLNALITRAEEQAGDKPHKALEQIRQIRAQAKDDLTWEDAYDIEQQLVDLYDESTLRIELERRLLEADQSLHPSVAQWYRDCAEEAEETPVLRALLSRLINDIQWRYTKNEATRGYTKQVTKRTELLVGIGAGLVLFYFVRSGLLGGQAFPMFVRVTTDGGIEVIANLAATDFAKLFIWCFIAGFSEKLVPNLLSKTEGQGADQIKPIPHPREPQPAVIPHGKADPGQTAHPDEDEKPQ